MTFSIMGILGCVNNGNSNLFPRSVVSQIDASNPGLHVQYILVE